MMKKIDAWLFYSEYSYNKKIESGYIDEIIRKAKEEYGINLEVKNIHKFTLISGEENKLLYDGVEVTELPKIAISRRYEIYLFRQFELLGVKVFNNVQSMIDARNKMKTHQMLANSGVKTPKTVYIVPKRTVMNIKYEDVSKLLGKKFILKWIYGSQGTFVHLVDNENDFNELVLKYQGKVLFQEFIEESFGFDIRAYVLGGEYVGCAVRKSSSGDFRSNLAKGGSALKFDKEDEIKNLAVQAAKAVNLDICGVDILVGKDGYYICEVNAIPGFKSISKVNSINEKDLILNLIRKKLDEK